MPKLLAKRLNVLFVRSRGRTTWIRRGRRKLLDVIGMDRRLTVPLESAVLLCERALGRRLCDTFTAAKIEAVDEARHLAKKEVRH